MISKKISDLKDIKFEISTALQFEPSHLVFADFARLILILSRFAVCRFLITQIVFLMCSNPTK